AHWNGCRLSALVGAVKFRAVNQCAAVVAKNRVFGAGLGTGSRGEYFVLQTARESNNTSLRFVGRQKGFAFLLVRGTERRELRVLLLFHFSGECEEGSLRLFIRKKQLVASETILDAARDECWVELDAFFLHAAPNIRANGISGLFAVSFESRSGGG